MNEWSQRISLSNQRQPDAETLRQAINRTREKMEYELHRSMFDDPIPKPQRGWLSKWQWRFKDALKALKGDFDDGYD